MGLKDLWEKKSGRDLMASTMEEELWVWRIFVMVAVSDGGERVMDLENLWVGWKK